MKRTADRLFGDAYYWSVLGAGRNQMHDRRAGGGDGRQRARRPRGQPVARPRPAREVQRRAGGEGEEHSGGARARGGDAGRGARDAQIERRPECRLFRFVCSTACSRFAGVRAGLAQQAGQVRLALSAGRLGRPAGAHVRGQARRLAEAELHRREPHRRLRHHRHRLRGEERARRLHLRLHLRHARGAPGAQPEAAVRPGEGLRAGDAGRLRADGDHHRRDEALQELPGRAGGGQVRRRA